MTGNAAPASATAGHDFGELPEAESSLATAAGLSQILPQHSSSAVHTLLRSCYCHSCIVVSRAVAASRLLAASAHQIGKFLLRQTDPLSTEQRIRPQSSSGRSSKMRAADLQNSALLPCFLLSSPPSTRAKGSKSPLFIFVMLIELRLEERLPR